tara:strand:+ start:1709 stop:2656 length:948 start_codon:yes stop_codon:yes gene_type:complete
MSNMNYPISQKLNISFLLLALLGWGTFQYLASHTHAPWMIFIYGVGFSLAMTICYSLLHESAHKLLFQNKKANYLGGAALGLIFIVSMSAFKKIHHGHHLRNRTDLEMFDLYYADDNKSSKVIMWYGILIGLVWPLCAFLTIAAFFIPPICKVLLHNKPIWTNSYAFLDATKFNLFRIWLEAFAILSFQLGMFFILDLKLAPFLILYAMHAFSWSSQNYVNHAFSPRDIINGAHNLKLNPLLKPFYLNWNYHLAHHQNPGIPWIHLPKFVETSKVSSYGMAYLKLWKGPRLTTEPAPKSLDSEFELYQSSMDSIQ